MGTFCIAPRSDHRHPAFAGLGDEGRLREDLGQLVRREQGREHGHHALHPLLRVVLLLREAPEQGGFVFVVGGLAWGEKEIVFRRMWRRQ